MATECARSTSGPEMTSGKSTASVGNIFSLRLRLNHSNVLGRLYIQS
eukprot:CAMPEP_0182582544 /NCGR_PEP_ID=MMETSP1324-20130603/52898_1 /TAXON_ID=236786 /ORGANISM="Florenciella sp., Strain RCC1587" /LENGTH=46 /DNA_ID= /DNA_START= /DNA_END= /DNA_ORIENTATION=